MHTTNQGRPGQSSWTWYHKIWKPHEIGDTKSPISLWFHENGHLHYIVSTISLRLLLHLLKGHQWSLHEIRAYKITNIKFEGCQIQVTNGYGTWQSACAIIEPGNHANSNNGTEKLRESSGDPLCVQVQWFAQQLSSVVQRWVIPKIRIPVQSGNFWIKLSTYVSMSTIEDNTTNQHIQLQVDQMVTRHKCIQETEMVF